MEITITPEYRALLNAISKKESGGRYNVRYGGETFDDYSDHPRVYTPITSGPHTGQKSSAAGKYQFIASTWDNIAKRYNISDFSPISQDKAAVANAMEYYRSLTGRSLQADLASRDPATLRQIGRTLSGQWAALPGGAQPGYDDEEWVSTLSSELQNPMSNEEVSMALSAASQAGESMAFTLSSAASQNASTGLTDAPVTSQALIPGDGLTGSSQALPAPPPPPPTPSRSRLEPLALSAPAAPESPASLRDKDSLRLSSSPRGDAKLRELHRTLHRDGRAPASFYAWLKSQGA